MRMGVRVPRPTCLLKRENENVGITCITFTDHRERRQWLSSRLFFVAPSADSRWYQWLYLVFVRCLDGVDYTIAAVAA